MLKHITLAVLSIAGVTLHASISHASGIDVGVIRGSEKCPGGGNGYYIHIDNEDTNNENAHAGWIGATKSNQYHTEFWICRADGNLFMPTTHPYMILSMGAWCPPGSRTVHRRFDGEDHNPASKTNIDGLAEGLPIPVVDGYKDVNLFFCLFEADPNMSWYTFPNIGVEYGVFAASDFPLASATGYVYLDDEDDKCWGCGVNNNMWCDATGPIWAERASWDCVPQYTGNPLDLYTSPYRHYYGSSTIMDGGLNTYMSIARVRNSVCNNGICGAGESCSSCSPDCGVCPACPDGSCNGYETCMSCPIDCGVCGGCFKSDGANLIPIECEVE